MSARAKVSKADLRRKVAELESQLAHVYYFADATLSKAGGILGSGVVLRLTALGGHEIIPAVCIKDGLSPETIRAIRADIRRSYDLATSLKPSKESAQ